MKSPYHFQSSWILHFDNAPQYKTIIRSLLLETFERWRSQSQFRIYRYSCGQGLHCLWGSAPNEEAFTKALAEINASLSQWINRKGRFSVALSHRQAFVFDREPDHENFPFHARRSLVGTPRWIRFQRRERYLEFLRKKINPCQASI